jgi:hypothetical protein
VGERFVLQGELKETKAYMLMREMNKTLVLVVAVLLVSLVACVDFVAAAPKPSVPEFTVKYTDYSYDVPAANSIDPFTGKTVTTPAQHIENKTIQLTIKNQTIGSSYYLYYEIRMKGQYSQDWTNLSSIQASHQSEFTELTYALAGNNASGHFDSRLNEISSGGAADFQVQAQIWNYVPSDDFYSQFGGGWHFIMSAYSDWSNTQTITIPEPSPSVTASPTLLPTSSPMSTFSPAASQSNNQGVSQAEFYTAVAVFSVIVVALSIGMIVLARKVKKANLAGNKE